jgi:hypothetical protein
VTAGADQLFQHHHALGDETAPAADQIALSNLAVIGEARVVGIVDADDGGHEPVLSRSGDRLQRGRS